MATKDQEELKKTIAEFNVNSDKVFYIECNEMYNRIHDTPKDENAEPYDEVIYDGEEGEYYGAAIFEDMYGELQNGETYYIQGVTKYTGNVLVRESTIHSITSSNIK